jgi:hypothetical protein
MDNPDVIGAVIDRSAATVLTTNQHGGLYHNGKAFTFEKKLEIAAVYQRLCAESGGDDGQPTLSKVSARQLAAEAKVSVRSALQVIKEIQDGGIKDPALKTSKSKGGVGSRIFTPTDESVLLLILRRNPSASLSEYRRLLYQATGCVASISTLSAWFLHRGPFKGSKIKSSVVPFDKYKRANLARISEFRRIRDTLDHTRLKFTDEKHLKGAELFNRKVRKCPMTGYVHEVVVDPDFRNTYTIIGFCGIDNQAPPFAHVINKYTNDATAFCQAVDIAIATGFLRRRDILVLDNASIHRFREASTLEDWLYEQFRIVLFFLPVRCPELNPIELMWNVLVQRLKSIDLSHRPRYDAVAYLAHDIMDGFTHNDVAKAYRKCGYNNF